ncbi:Gmad2 immunoglobulin-like domain-containing protein [Nocardioides solisilvae]|uniref:Gmad2 immunoglobulin-like domain-containing protein n=1 Tax=Nocardioides solisilvae TaxID=1542435 RepID=UPI0013A52EE5|nr:Gmad2 immunoglobulin-like domain-containing protein [Nocardioides solisilvae]
MTAPLRRSSRPVPRHRPATRATGLAVAALATSLLLAGCGDDDGEETARDTATSSSPAATPSPSASPSDEPAEPTGTADGSPADQAAVYFVVDTRAGLRLARESQPVSGDPAVGALEAMVAGPVDPDLTTSWDPATRVLSAELGSDGVVTVDLSAEARQADVGSPGAAAMVQQLVWTVTEALDPDASVRLLVEGEPAGELWGAVSWDEPVTRAAAEEVRAPVTVDIPSEGATVASPVSVNGEASAFEANVPWRVLDDRGREVDSGFTTAEEAMTFAPFYFDVRLEPGTYVIEVLEDDPSGGEGGEPYVESRTVTVE